MHIMSITADGKKNSILFVLPLQKLFASELESIYVFAAPADMTFVWPPMPRLAEQGCCAS